MVDQFNQKYVNRFLNNNDWNHYYVEAKGNHIKAWLNGVSTIDVIHENGPIDGRLGFELCNGLQVCMLLKGLHLVPFDKHSSNL